MAILPTVDQYPSFGEVCGFLKADERQCIWFLPEKGKERLCFCKITAKRNEEALALVEGVQKPNLTVASRIPTLEKVAELCCCLGHHRNKMCGIPDLKTKLAKLWNKELKVAPTSSTRKDPIRPSIPVRTFGKHQVHTGESMFERICSPLNLEKGTKGSIYFYTHKSTDFDGMIKIGYTCNNVATRLLDWELCGHGKPDLLDSISNVRHPERVELLTHFELIEVWHEMMWCPTHERTHIEWFMVKLDNAKAIASCWNEWMHKANPYDRRGKLTPWWRARCAALQKLNLPITAEMMLRWYEMDVGLLKKEDLTEADIQPVKQEESVKKPVTPRKPTIQIKVEVDGSLDRPIQVLPPVRTPETRR